MKTTAVSTETITAIRARASDDSERRIGVLKADVLLLLDVLEQVRQALREYELVGTNSPHECCFTLSDEDHAPDCAQRTDGSER